MQSFPLSLTLRSLFPTQVYRPKKTLQVNLFPHFDIYFVIGRVLIFENFLSLALIEVQVPLLPSHAGLRSA